ncbi:hypothetical protein ACZ11_09895 [Lysinibacillus xylanilyticus]|uniref:Uncharacterized protein n=1 Tax=Lysinibacillus xylanilyticus TaxID=582475 RepID=A0A0K9FCX6_9BACI|nr:hypothetical protein [Lysinibacillus xylanilyticus]KMY32429.1 hypothetical protein ACZ11_09895 [Lysinibacillus xylanilyticus]
MGFFIVIMGFIILVGMISLIKKEFYNYDSSTRSHSNHSNTHIDYSSTNTSVEDLNRHNCSDSASSYSDTSSCSDSGSSSE